VGKFDAAKADLTAAQALEPDSKPIKSAFATLKKKIDADKVRSRECLRGRACVQMC
jgi:hypothetical protein